MSVVLVEVAAPNDLDAAFQTFAHERTQAVIVLHDSLFFSEHRRIVTLAAAGRLPTIWTTREFAEDGGLITYGLDEGDGFRRAAGYLVKILRGAKAGDLPIELPVKFELVINLKTAKALGIDVPPTLLARADEVSNEARRDFITMLGGAATSSRSGFGLNVGNDYCEPDPALPAEAG